MEKYFNLTTIVSVIAAILVVFILMKVYAAFWPSKPAGITEAEYLKLSAEEQKAYKLDSATKMYVKA